MPQYAILAIVAAWYVAAGVALFLAADRFRASLRNGANGFFLWCIVAGGFVIALAAPMVLPQASREICASDDVLLGVAIFATICLGPGLMRWRSHVLAFRYEGRGDA